MTNIKNRILLVCGFFVIVLIIVFLFSKNLFGSKKVTNTNLGQQNDLLVIQKIEGGDLNADTDGDGLKNWEEALLGTNPNIKDNPNQNIEGSTSPQFTPIAKDDPLNDVNNLTAQFSKNAYTMASYLNSNGVSDNQTIDEVSKGLISGEITKLLIKKYTVDDLKNVDKNDTTTLKNYGNQLANYVDTSFKIILNIDEEKILNTYTQSKDAKDLSKLKTKIDSLETLQSNLKNMIVPKVAAQNHLNILNSTASYIAILKNINTVNTDPIRAVVGYKALPQILLNFFNNFIDLNKFFKENKVTFSNNEKWFVFINKTK